MKLTTIWDPRTRGYSLRERLNRTGEALMLELAHRLPRRLAYWSLVDVGARYTTSPAHRHEVVPEVRFMDVLEDAGQALR